MSDVTVNPLATSDLAPRELLRRRYANHFKPFYQDNLMAFSLAWWLWLCLSLAFTN